MGKSLDKKVLDRENKTNNISLFAIRYSLFAVRILVPILLLPVLTLNAQVIIKEKVEINPQKPLQCENPIITFPDSVYNGSGNKSITKNSQYQPDIPQSIIFLPEGGRLKVIIINSEAAASAKIDLLLRQPTQQLLYEYVNHNIGEFWVSEGYPPNTSIEFGIYWYWNDWGTIYEGDESGAIITQIDGDTYIIRFEAAGDDWDYNELEILIIVERYKLLTEINPQTISLGETAVINVKKQFYDGRIEEFAEDQLFEFGMMEGCAAGVLVSGTDTSNYFSAVRQPIMFVAADSLESGSDTVLVGVGLVEGPNGGGGSSRMFTEKIISEEMKYKISGEKDKSKVNLMMGETCFNGYLNSTLQDFVPLVVGGVIEIKYVDGDRFIDGTPKMPSMFFIAIPKFQIIASFNLDWELEVKWVDERDTPYRTTVETFSGQESGFGNGPIIWAIPWGEKIIGGDEIKITATIVYNGFTYKTSKRLNMRIIGKNPTVQEVKDGLNIHEQIVVYLESLPKWKHFNESENVNGFPIWGWPHGYGLMQIDPPSNNDQIWNWKVSREEGKRRLNEKKQGALLYPSTIRNGMDSRRNWYPHFKNKKSYSRVTDFIDDLNSEQLWKEAHHRYRGGSYWRWYPDDPRDQNSTGEWRAEPQNGHTRGEDSWQMKIDVEQGNYPELWN